MNQPEMEIKTEALEPLYAPWEEPVSHRTRPDKPGGKAKVIKGRRPSPIVIVNNVRNAVREWREMYYVGASDTSIQLLNHWFNRDHKLTNKNGEEFDFRYYFCQREAIETLVYLKEVRQIDTLSKLVHEFSGEMAEIAAMGVTDEEDAWSRYAFKLATGAGKTKCMSLAVVWSYFHSLRESESPMARHFVVIAPNLTVYERLKEDFGDGKIFDSDPLIPSEWRGDWNLSVVLQDEATGATTGGVLYLTNIQRLYDTSKRKQKKDEQTYSWMGPNVSKNTALDTGDSLRERITSHPRLMVLNDEAHHVWDPDSAWNEAIKYLHDTVKSRTGGELCAQLDFSATPKDNKGQVFKHVVCDTPLGEAVDAGIVKTPIIGRTAKLKDEASDNAAYRFDRHLALGYERWRLSKEEWQKSGKKALLFVMCEDTKAADEITTRLNTDERFKELNGKTINLHTNLKGKVKAVGSGASKRYEFVESEKEISDDDLRELRKLSRELDENASPYFCIVSVLMLREGWDVRNVTTIVPLRPYSSKANILPEQTLGRGLRRMTPPGQACELVTVVEHPAFASLYQQELAQEGLPIEVVDIDKVPKTTVSIFPDPANKDIEKLAIEIPSMSAGHRTLSELSGLSIDDVRAEFGKYKKLPLEEKGLDKIEYEGRHLFTGEIVEKMEINLPLLETGMGAVSYFVQQLENICKLRGTHKILAPLVQVFLEEILFEKRATIFDQALISRLGDSDVSEHVRAVFVPLIRKRTITTEKRMPAGGGMKLADWKPYQVTHSERHPTIQAMRTLFNLVPCNRDLEVAMSGFLDKASDVAAFAKNAGPQCLRIDYMTGAHRLAFYTPDFFARTNDGGYYLIETKGRSDIDVPRKAKAAVEWCKSASKSGVKWEYLYVPQDVFERQTSNSISALARACTPALQEILGEDTQQLQLPLFATPEDKKPQEEAESIGIDIDLNALPTRYRNAVSQAISILKFLENKENVNYSPVFGGLLGSIDEAAKGLILRRLSPALPATVPEQKAWFSPYLDSLEDRLRDHYRNLANNLRKTVVFKNGVSPLGLLRSCFLHALIHDTDVGGVFKAVRKEFSKDGDDKVLEIIEKVNEFRNIYVAHSQKELNDGQIAKDNLKHWANALTTISKS